MDVHGFLTEVAAQSEVYGFDNVDEACISVATRQRVFCTKPGAHLFWDGQHPTRAGHSVVADYALQILAAE